MVNSNPATVLDSWSSISEKTVFILDRSKYFTHVSSGHSIDGDCLKDSKKTAHLYADQPSVEPFDRSLWTCTVEAVVGYSRLVWDIFTPDQRAISILSLGTDVTATTETSYIEKICGWQDEDQNLDHMLKAFAKKSHTHQVIPPQKLAKVTDIAAYPNCSSDSLAIINSLNRALEELSSLTKAQVDKKLQPSSSTSISTSNDNNGRIILISSFNNEDSIKNLVDKFGFMLKIKNDSLKKSNTSNVSSINYCDLVIVNTFPITDIGSCSKIGNFNSFRPFLHSKIFSVKSGRIIAGLLNNLCLQHHNLRSTTITGIPMKEEQNASSSSQYDVEIVHCSSIHQDIMDSGSPLFEGVVEIIDRNGFPCDTFKLSWCTPRTTTVELNHCVATSRITAVDINSRPSACLTNFLLNGRAVMLEIFKSKSNRMTTHILASHNGELYIHSLPTMQQKQNLGDPPSLSDHLGGKVTDYRLNEFTSFMRRHTLCRSLTEEPLTKTCNIIKRQTLYWPLTVGHTILLNVPNLLETIIQLIPKESLSLAELEECKRAIDNLIKFENDGQALPSVSIIDIIKSTKANNSKLDQLYKLLWNELEYFIRVHSSTPEHETVLQYLLDHKKIEIDKGNKRVANKNSPAGPIKKMKPTSSLLPEINDSTFNIQQTTMFYRSGISLLQTWSQLYQHFHRNKNKLTFVGRSQTHAQLYQPQQQQSDATTTITTTTTTNTVS